MVFTGGFRRHPPALWRHILKIDLLKTTRKVLSARQDFARFPNHLPIGTQAPDFVLETADGVSISLSTLRGRIVVLEFGAIT